VKGISHSINCVWLWWFERGGTGQHVGVQSKTAQKEAETRASRCVYREISIATKLGNWKEKG
jgi:hypothetical protein